MSFFPPLSIKFLKPPFIIKKSLQIVKEAIDANLQKFLLAADIDNNKLKISICISFVRFLGNQTYGKGFKGGNKYLETDKSF